MIRVQKQTDMLLAELKGFIDQGKPVILPVNGVSMLPFIIGGRENVEFHPLQRPPRRGDVVVAKVDEGYFVVHRVVIADGQRLTLEGDGNIGIQEHCSADAVIAVGINVIDAKGRKRSLVSDKAMKRWRMWMALKPLRRILLKVVRIMWGVKVPQRKA